MMSEVRKSHSPQRWKVSDSVKKEEEERKRKEAKQRNWKRSSSKDKEGTEEKEKMAQEKTTHTILSSLQTQSDSKSS